MKNASQAIAASALLLLAGWYFYAHSSAPNAAPQNQSSAPNQALNQAPGQELTETPNNIERMQREEAQEEALERLTGTPTSAALYHPENDHFTTPVMLGPNNFATELTQVDLDASCLSRKYKPEAGSVETQLQENYGISGSARVPEDLFFESLTQFYQRGDRYFQFSALAKPASRPPVYKIEFYAASDKMMLKDVVRSDPPVAVPPHLDAIGVKVLLNQLMQNEQARGAVFGARELQVRVTGAQGQADQEIQFLNAKPVQWAFGSGVCQLAEQRNRALCRCLPDGENQAIPHY
jgi:hypothetical protein